MDVLQGAVLRLLQAALAFVVSPLTDDRGAGASPLVNESPPETPTPSNERTTTSTLMSGETLRAGESVRSASGRCQLTLHRNGNLTLRSYRSRAPCHGAALM